MSSDKQKTFVLYGDSGDLGGIQLWNITLSSEPDAVSSKDVIEDCTYRASEQAVTRYVYTDVPQCLRSALGQLRETVASKDVVTWLEKALAEDCIAWTIELTLGTSDTPFKKQEDSTGDVDAKVTVKWDLLKFNGDHTKPGETDSKEFDVQIDQDAEGLPRVRKV